MGITINRRRVMGGGEKLPYDYEVKWIQPNGKCYIDTGYTPNDNTSLYIDFIFESNKTVAACAAGWLNSSFGVYCDTTEIYVYTNKSYPVVVENAQKGERYRVYYDTHGNCTVNGQSVSIPSFNISGYCSLALFCEYRKGSYGYHDFSTNKIHEVILREQGIEILHYISVVKDGVGCMYDKVSETFFYNGSSSGNFIVGPRVS